MTLKNEKRFSEIPVCIGMPRSASRMTWQIVKSFLPPEPQDWQAHMRKYIPSAYLERNCHHIEPWPPRSHDFIEGDQSIIYTYRDPIEAYLSLYTSGQKEVSHEECAKEILSHVQIQKKLEDSRKTGRKVLCLKYEKYSKDNLKRIEEIADFLEVRLTPKQKENIAHNVSLKSNLQRSKQFPKDLSNPFRNWEDKNSGMQGNHINEDTLGGVGKYLQLYPDELQRVLRSPPESVFGKLLYFAHSMGYTYLRYT